MTVLSSVNLNKLTVLGLIYRPLMSPLQFRRILPSVPKTGYLVLRPWHTRWKTSACCQRRQQAPVFRLVCHGTQRRSAPDFSRRLLPSRYRAMFYFSAGYQLETAILIGWWVCLHTSDSVSHTINTIDSQVHFLEFCLLYGSTAICPFNEAAKMVLLLTAFSANIGFWE